MPHNYDQASRASLDALPYTDPLACSSVLGWTPLLVRHSRCTGGEAPYDTVPTPDHKLVVVTKGEADVEIHKRGVWHKTVYRPGTAGLSPPGLVDRLRVRPRGRFREFEKLHVFIPAALIAEAAEHLRRPGQRAPTASLPSTTISDRAIAHTAGALIAALGEQASNFYAEAAAQWLAIQLLNAPGFVDSADDTRRIGPIADARLRRALDYIAANFAAPLTLEAVACEAGVSKFHFTRLFRERLGITPMQYLAELRLGTATKMLETSDLPIAQIALECGYTRATHFNEAFARRHDCAPSAHRRRQLS